MEIAFTTKHCEIPESLKVQTEERLRKLEKLSGKITGAHVTLEVEKYRHIAEIRLSGNGSEIVSKCESQDMAQALKKAMDVVARQARDRKEKIVSRKGKKAQNLKTLPLVE